MAISEIHAAPQPSRLKAIVMAYVGGLAQGIRGSLQAEQRLDQIRYLQSLSDAELNARGISRDGIARHVFRDLFDN